MRPVIGVTGGFGPDPAAPAGPPRCFIPADYLDAVFAAGGVPRLVAIPPEYDQALLDDLLTGLTGLIFTGGPDLHPRHYGNEPLHPLTKPLPERRDRFEVDFFRRADRAGLPILAICLGHQVAHVARGGGLIQHVDDLNLTPPIQHYTKPQQPNPDPRGEFHAVRVAPDSHLATIIGQTEFEVNSRHHQVVDVRKPPRGLRPVAFAPDGVLEAAEEPGERLLLSVQWHPENLCDRPEHLRLFEALVAAARRVAG